MKLKNISIAVLAFLLLALFIPVFYQIIFVGNNVNYNEIHKITTFYGNKQLILLAVAGMVVLLVLFYLLRKIPYNRYTIAGFVIFSLVVCILFYVVNVKISKCIAFYGGWDCGMVANSARWIYDGGELGGDDYYTIYSNNIPITWLLYKLYTLAAGASDYPYNTEFIWIQFQCAMFAAAVLFSVMTVIIISKKIATAGLVLLVNCLFLGLSPWKIIPYTDAMTIAVPVFNIFLYALFVQRRTRYRYALWMLMVFAGILGGIMKATSYVTLIAILLVDFAWVLWERKAVARKEYLVRVLKEYLIRIVLLVGAFLLASYCKSGMYQTLNYEYNYDMEMTWSNYLYNGLNELTTGACSGDGLSIVRAYAGYPRSVREAVEIQYIKDRMKEKGFGGLLDFWLRKQVMNYNNGTFSWFQEGYFNAWAYDEITDSNWKEPLRNFYWEDGEDFILFNTISQGIWLFILAGVVLEAVLALVTTMIRLKKRVIENEEEDSENRIRTVSIVTFIGVFLFVMLFEGRARYLYNSIPVFSTMAVMAYCTLGEKLWARGRSCLGTGKPDEDSGGA